MSTPSSIHKIDTSESRLRGRPYKVGQKGRAGHVTPSGPTRRSQSVVSQADELSLDSADATKKIKDEASTPRLLREETGDTTADESVASRRNVASSTMQSRSTNKRKRQDSFEETPPSVPPTHVQWTRHFPKVSQSALDQIGSHRHANMFANPIRERDAPGYNSIVLQPQDITSIKKAITHGNRIATQMAASLPGGDPLTPTVLLPVNEDIVPPKGIINTSQLERELVHMFCNAVMYNPAPDRGTGPKFWTGGGADGGENLGYEVDENGVVKNTCAMFLEVEKLLGDLRNAEKQRSGPQPPNAGATRPTNAATGVGDETMDEMDELAHDEASSNTGRKKRTKG